MSTEPQFLRRFEQVRAGLLRSQVGIGLAATILVAATGLGVLSGLDYARELPRPPRAAGLALVGLIAAAVAARWLVVPLRWWTQPRTAAEIEARFPELGQRVRTVVQFAGQPGERVAAEGVKPSLVAALEVETAGRAGPLPLDRIGRWRGVAVLAALAAVPTTLLALAALRDAEWRIALGRALLIERPYTTIEVRPGDVLVDRDADVPVRVVLSGRPRAAGILQTRPLARGDASWESRTLDRAFETVVPKVKDPVEYRVVAGPARSAAHTIRVRYPLAIRTLEVDLKPPGYTGLDPRTVRGGDVQAVEGSVATIRVALDGVPDSAALELVDPARPAAKPGEPAPAPTPTVVPLRLVGESYIATLDLTKSLAYGIVARTADGRVLPKNKYRIDVQEDRAPRVSFDEPDEALEVHPIAEVHHRIRVGDDFGVARAGIVYRLNDGPEQTLTARDLTPTPGQKPKTTATLEDTLLIETLRATPQDSVTYYAFAEDNYPGSPRRTETDLRYIDLRKFKREYKLDEAASGDGDPLDLIALDELVARQRVNLNRAHRLARRRPNDRTEADDPLKITGFEESLLNLTKEFTTGVEQLADARVDALHKALDAMQASIDALDQGHPADAPAPMAEALKHLVAARRELINMIAQTPALAQAMRSFDRRQAQKIRRPKNKDEEAEEIAERLEELAKEEDFVYATIAKSMGTDPADAPPSEAPKAEAKPETEAKAEAKPETEAKAEAKAKDPAEPAGQDEPPPAQDGPKGDASKGQDPPPGSDGPPGQGPQGLDGSKGQGSRVKEQRGDAEGDEKSAEPPKLDRREVTDKQAQLADAVRDLEEKLKRLEAASDLAKARMSQASGKAEQVSGALNRGNAKEAADEAKAGAGMLHELARQVKGEIAREATDELAMARDLAGELARREAELAARAESGGPGPQQGPEKKDGPNAGATEAKDQGSAKAEPGGQPGRGGWEGLTEAEQVDRMAEMARTLEGWLKQVDKRGEGKSASGVRELLDNGAVAEVVERAARMGDLSAEGRREELSKEARELAARLDAIAQALEVLHQGIVAPELAAVVELDRRLDELLARLATLKTREEVAAWKRDLAALIRDLDKAKVVKVADAADALMAGGDWHWDDARHRFVGPDVAATTLRDVSVRIKDRVQDLILKDLTSARDEATPPAFRELVDRYYEVISRGAQAR